MQLNTLIEQDRHLMEDTISGGSDTTKHVMAGDATIHTY